MHWFGVVEHAARLLNLHYSDHSDRISKIVFHGGAVRVEKEEMKDILQSLKAVRRRACETMISATKL
ncbi:MAG TPA: hypothetical protein VHF65_10815 [Nitrososphaera sp.]|nr:hypothetical protein [Nitrososphaera sp.]